ncbi:MAG: tetratricopeptide repeat protein [Verrucomicrobiae bacterium]|nr:tetratricopeptide repeat protein [Verrucomicrobiae bacterium]MCX7721449.1 tetratricopeptide repeat protein [Verrucomicrobiae bacterium]MDW7979576.1 tetratricopeptide repeat protein [Verrucomicrobiales bacterium]
MLRNKKRVGACLACAGAVALTSCAPSGADLVRDAKRLMGEGRRVESVQKLKLAASLLPTNALVWNELGLAYHYAGDLTNAAAAYAKALKLNRDLAEARFNLGCLLFEQGRLDAARAELTAYTLQRPSDVAGWLRLGSVQLRLRDAAGAEKSFAEALKLEPKNPAALNGLGVALAQRNRPKEAAEAFGAALDAAPDFAPAALNLAIVAHAQLNNRLLAIEKYRQYATLTPRAPDAHLALNMAEQLERELAAPTRAVVPEPPAQPVGPKPQQPTVSTAAPAASPKLETAAQPPRPGPAPEAVVPSATTPQRQPESPQPREQASVAPAPPVSAPSQPATPAPATATTSGTSLAARQAGSDKPGVLGRLNPLNWFRSSHGPAPTPLPPRTEATPGQAESAAAPVPRPAQGAQAVGTTGTSAVQLVQPSAPRQPPPGQPAVVHVPRYAYRRIPKPQPGDAQRAQAALARGIEAYRARRLSDAIEAYKQAAQADPSSFEAHYNLGVAAYESKAYSTALAAYETALAIVPDSTLARYNFALALRDAGYLLDAAAELEKVVAADPNDVQARIALGNLYAQRLGNRAQARVHYLRVLELEPGHPQATAIRYWLASNPE